MTTDNTEMLTRVLGAQDELKAGQAEMAGTLAEHGQVLRMISEQLGVIHVDVRLLGDREVGRGHDPARGVQEGADRAADCTGASF